MPKKIELVVVCIVVIMMMVLSHALPCHKILIPQPVLGIMGCLGPKLDYCLIMATHCCKLGEIMENYIDCIRLCSYETFLVSHIVLVFIIIVVCINCILLQCAPTYNKALDAI